MIQAAMQGVILELLLHLANFCAWHGSCIVIALSLVIITSPAIRLAMIYLQFGGIQRDFLKAGCIRMNVTRVLPVHTSENWLRVYADMHPSYTGTSLVLRLVPTISLFILIR